MWLVALGAVTLEVLSAAWWLRWRFVRYAVEGESMLPALRPGDWLIADRGPLRNYRPRSGDIVLVRDPEAPARMLVKRFDHLDLHGNAWVLGDNAAYSRDSRTFGAVPRGLITARVRWRYWPPVDFRFPISDFRLASRGGRGAGGGRAR